MIEPGMLPKMVPSHTTPVGVLTTIQDVMKGNGEPGSKPSTKSAISVAKQIATTLGYAVSEVCNCRIGVKAERFFHEHLTLTLFLWHSTEPALLLLRLLDFNEIPRILVESTH